MSEEETTRSQRSQSESERMHVLYMLWILCNYLVLPKLREHCAIALGQMGVSERDSTHCHALLEALFSVREEKAMELQFTVGEAVSCVAVGPLSTALVDPWNTEQRDRYSLTHSLTNSLTNSLTHSLTNSLTH